MLLYSVRNAVVHPCKTFFLMFPLWSVGEGTTFENALFLKNLQCAIFEAFRPTGATHLTDVNVIWQDGRD